MRLKFGNTAVAQQIQIKDIHSFTMSKAKKLNSFHEFVNSCSLKITVFVIRYKVSKVWKKPAAKRVPCFYRENELLLFTVSMVLIAYASGHHSTEKQMSNSRLDDMAKIELLAPLYANLSIHS